MSVPMTADQWLAALKAEGITKIVQMDGWRTHNRNHKRAWGEVHGVLIHHTVGVGTGMADYCYNGTPALPGPLCHDFLAKNGTLYLVGNGRTNHAGTIAANAHNAFAAETMPMNGTFKPDASEPYDGNRELYGLEIENRGDGSDPYPAAQYDVAVRWAAARCRFHGWTAGSVAGHKEVTRRKIDPSFSTALFRTHVAQRLAAKSPAPKPPKDADMDPIDVWSYKNEKQNEASVKAGKGAIPDMHQRLVDVDNHVDALTALVVAQGKKLDALAAALKAEG